MPATGSDLLKRFDAEVIGNIISTSGQPIPRHQIATHPQVTTALLSAKGRIKAALRAGGRYTTEDLDSLDSDSKEHLIDLECLAAMVRLLRFKPGIYPELLESLSVESENYLKKLTDGEDVFGIDAHVESGLLDHAKHTSLSAFKRGLKSDRLVGRIFPIAEDL